MSTQHNIPAIEKGIYSQFLLNKVAFRKGHLSSRIIDLNSLELPNNSVLHTVDQFLTPNTRLTMPDLTNPLIENERYQIFLNNVIDIPNAEHVFGVSDKYRFIKNKAINENKRFFLEHRSFRKMLNRASVIARSTYLSIFNYNAILLPIITGIFIPYRRFDLLFRTILDNVSSIENKHQYIQIPISDKIYGRSIYLRAFNKIDRTTIRVKDDFSFYFLLHLYTLFVPTSNVSLFKKLTQAQLDTLNIILTCGDKCIIYNLGDLKELATNETFYFLVYKHIAKLKILAKKKILDITETELDDIVNTIEEEHQKDEAAASVHDEPIDDTIIDDTPLIKKSSFTPSVKKPLIPKAIPVAKTDLFPAIIPEETKEQIVQPKTITQTIDDTTKTAIVDNTNLTDVQKKNAVKIAEKYKDIRIDGVRIQTILNTTSNPKYFKETIDVLKDDLVDPSMAESSIMNFDKYYVEQLMQKHIMSVATSFSASDMYLTNVEKKDINTQLNRIRQYKLTYTDGKNKKHTINFKLPIVSPDGTFLVDGVERRMSKQMVNKPICKISPVRVSLASNYNKTLVERIEAKAHSFDTFILKFIAYIEKNKLLKTSYGGNVPKVKLPYEYSCLASRYQQISFNDYNFIFSFNERFANIPALEALSSAQIDRAASQEKNLGIYCGTHNKDLLFYGFNNHIYRLDTSGNSHDEGTILNILHNTFGDKITLPKLISEWTELKIQDKNFPIIFVLAFKYGLKTTLDHLKINYTITPKNERIPNQKPSTLVVSFEDVNLSFDRYPLNKSLIVAGLNKYKLNKYKFEDFEKQDVFYNLLTSNNLSINYLKGITSFFDFFIDPITKDILLQMNEPTNVRDLLIRATDMVADNHHIEASSIENHRLRGYERFPAILYNEMSRALATYNTKRSANKVFSIPPDAVFLRIIQDQSINLVETINPIQDIKSKVGVTYTGMGGRTSQSFVINDRRYPEDAVGILAESTPDSGKVAISAFLSSDPKITNLSGVFDTSADKKTLTPTNVWSPTALLLPGVTQDDGKRQNFVSIQLSHHVPCENSEVSRVRTGYEKVVAHYATDMFSYAAERNGIIEDIDNNLKIVKIRYDNDKIDAKHKLTIDMSFEDFDYRIKKNIPIFLINYGNVLDKYKLEDLIEIRNTPFRIVERLVYNTIEEIPDIGIDQSNLDALKKANTSNKPYTVLQLVPPAYEESNIDIVKFGTRFSLIAGSYLRQTIVLNVEKGERIKKGDIIAYNSGFFEPDPYSKQVDWKHGVMAHVAILETDDTLEDSNAISQELSKKLSMSPAHDRAITITGKTVIHDIVNIGQQVQTTDPLCIIEDSDLDLLSSYNDESMIDLLSSLNKKQPKAKHSGYIADIDILYSCPLSDMHPSIVELIKKIDNRKAKLSNIASNTKKKNNYAPPGKIPIKTKYKGVTFDKDTVLIIFTISEELDCGIGDKLVYATSLKSIVANVMEKVTRTVSGLIVDAHFSAKSIRNRIINSPWIIGITNRILMKMEDVIIEKYFKK